MSELRTISVCQSPICQDKGAKHVLRTFEQLLDDPAYSERYTDLQLSTDDCPGECEFGPIVRVNDAITLRECTPQSVQQLLNDPSSVLGSVIHVQDKDRETFLRILEGELY